MASWEELYRQKVVSAQKAISLIRSGARILIGSGCGQPQSLVDALVGDGVEIVDAEIYHLLTHGKAPYIDEKFSRRFRTNSFFVGENVRQGIANGLGDYTPVFLSDIPTLFKTGKLPLDVCLVQTSPPDKNGHLSLGISVDIVKAAIENSLMVIAEVNPRMPRTLGESFVPVQMVDLIVESDKELLEHVLPQPDDITAQIARNIASLVEDGSTIQVGISTLAQSVLQFLTGKHDLGMHSEMFCDTIIPLVEEGVINGRRKSINRGKITASFCCGTRKLYDYIHENQLFEFRPSEYVNDPLIIAQHQKMVAINEAFEVDMTGQICCDSQGYQFVGGFGGQVDFCRGAGRSRDGKSIIALASTTAGGSAPRIVPHLSEGAGVVVTRADVHYVVTEYGVADLFGKSIRERVMELANISHPDFCNDILNEAKNRKYIYSDQKVLPASSRYPAEFEQHRPLTDGTSLFFRPVKPTDETALRNMLYKVSERSIAFRFIKPIKAFPHKFVQEFAIVDYSKDMAIVALAAETGGEQIVGVGRYYLNPSTNRGEVSFLVRDDWQAKGIGTDLLEIITGIARKRGVLGFEANVLGSNEQMLTLFYNSGFNVSTKRVDDMYVINYDFKS